MDKKILFLSVILISFQSLAGFGVYVGGVSGSVDTKSFTMATGLTGNSSQTGFEGGVFYEHDFNSVFGIRVGAESHPIGWNASFSSGFSYNTTLYTFAAPLYLDFHFGSVFELLLGGEYWTLNGMSWTVTGGTLSTTGIEGSGITPRGGLGFNLGPKFEISAWYIPSILVFPGTSTNMTVTQYALDFAYKF